MRRPWLNAADVRTGWRRIVPSVLDDETNFSDWSLLIAEVGNQYGVVLRAAREPHAGEQARREQEIGVAQNRAAPHRAGVGVDAVVDEVHVAVVRERRVARRPARETPGSWLRGAHVAHPSPASRWYFRNAASSASKVTWIGSSDTIVVSSVDSAVPPLMRLPSVTTRLLTRPLIGAFTCV